MFTALTLAAALAAPVPKSEPPLVAWRLAKGDTFYLTYEIESLTEPIGLGLVPSSGSAGRLVARVSVTAVGDKGVSLEMEVLEFATGRDVFNKNPQRLNDHPTAVGSKANFTLDRTLAVVRVQSDKGLATADGGFGPGLLADAPLQAMVSDLTLALPNKRLAKGDTWEGVSEYPLGESATAALTARGTVTAATDDRVTLSVECDRKTTGTLSVALDESSGKGKRTVVFDPKAGRLRKLTDEYTREGDRGFDDRKFKVKTKTISSLTVTDDKPKVPK